MNLIIVSWNIQGQYSLAQLVDRFLANGWDVLIVLEPQAESSRRATPSVSGVTIQTAQPGRERIHVLTSAAVASATLTDVRDLGDEQGAVCVDIVATLGARYRILAGHAPYHGNSGVASQYQHNVLAWARRHGVDLVIGDMNTYASQIGSSSRSTNYHNLSSGMVTSRGNSPLDKALLKDGYYGLESDVNASVMEIDDIELPESSVDRSGKRASSRTSVMKSSMGSSKKSDHRPVVVSMPAQVLHSRPTTASPSSLGSGRGATSIAKDGNCLYRCIAQIVWGDQNRYLEVRRALADHALANWALHPWLAHLEGIGQLGIYVALIRSTNAWGGEFELATLAQIYGLRITMQSPQGYALAVYGSGSRSGFIRHTGDHFEVE